MDLEIKQMQDAYSEKVTIAHEAFREGNLVRLAKSFLEQGEISKKLYETEGSEFWDFKTYLAYNAAGGALEEIGNFELAAISYELALASFERVAIGRDTESWQKNANHLRFLIERASGKST